MSSAQTLARLGRVTARSPFPYATSWPIEEITVAEPRGTELSLLLKRYDEATERPVPAALRDARREPAVYQLLEASGVPVPRMFGAGHDWLLIERMPGVPLWQAGDLDAWLEAARWAAALHAAFASRLPESSALLLRDAAFFMSCFDRALARSGAGADLLDLQSPVEAAIARLSDLPLTLIHGELYPSNVLTCDGRATAVDWEMAGLGPGVIDLAALITGWSEDAQAALVSAYGRVDRGDLAAAQLVLALQWIGWNAGWEPPSEHRQDWLAEARAAAEVLR